MTTATSEAIPNKRKKKQQRQQAEQLRLFPLSWFESSAKPEEKKEE
jgi:hypothetical protein